MLVSRRSSSLASNGLEAVKTVRGKPAAYDIVLIDINIVGIYKID